MPATVRAISSPCWKTRVWKKKSADRSSNCAKSLAQIEGTSSGMPLTAAVPVAIVIPKSVRSWTFQRDTVRRRCRRLRPSSRRISKHLHRCTSPQKERTVEKYHDSSYRHPGRAEGFPALPNGNKIHHLAYSSGNTREVFFGLRVVRGLQSGKGTKGQSATCFPLPRGKVGF